MRELNACGFSIETIAAEYETDAALVEAGHNVLDPYFLAAFAAEDAHRNLDRAAVAQRNGVSEAPEPGP
jgi:hypothetical protein